MRLRGRRAVLILINGHDAAPSTPRRGVELPAAAIDRRAPWVLPVAGAVVGAAVGACYIGANNSGESVAEWPILLPVPIGALSGAVLGRSLDWALER